jgi:hypothetical protein
MKNTSIAVLAVAAGVSFAATAFADTVAYPLTNTTTFVRDPVTGTLVELPVVVYEPVYQPQVVYTEPEVVTYSSVAPETQIVVTAPRDANTDYLINRDVADNLAADPSLRGHIETQAYRGVVTLGGRVTTPGMVDRAQRDAMGVDGVRDVENLIRPVVGGS